MDPLYDLSISSDDDLIERPIRRYRPRFNFEAETDEQIINYFRLRRNTILMLEERIHVDIQPTYATRQTDLTPLLQLLIAIR